MFSLYPLTFFVLVKALNEETSFELRGNSNTVPYLKAFSNILCIYTPDFLLDNHTLNLHISYRLKILIVDIL